jgi:RNA polymerase sigma-70 factor (ECF subfamily)
VWRKAARFDSGLGKAKTWVMTIAHRRAVDAVRRSESQKRQDHRAAPETVSHDEPADLVIRVQEHDAVRECMETLTELQLESVRLAYFNGYTYNEVATLLDKPLPTIKTRMRDGLIRLRDCLGGHR